MTEEQRDAVLLDTNTKVGQLEVHVKGNGGKGLIQRMNTSEEWQGKHENRNVSWHERHLKDHPAAPLSRKEILKRRGLEVAVIGIVITILQITLKLLRLI